VILIAVICAIFSIYRVSEVNSKLDSLLSSPDAYPDFTSLAFWQITFNSAVAVMVFICWVKVSQYLAKLMHTCDRPMLRFNVKLT